MSIESIIIGDKVLYQSGCLWNSWIHGTVTRTEDGNDNKTVQFVVNCGSSIVSATNEELRVCDFDVKNHLQTIIHHLKYNANGTLLTEICQTLNLNVHTIGDKLLLESAACGNVEAFQWLVIENNVDMQVRDAQGRSIVQIAIVNKHDHFVQFIVDCFNSGRLPATSFDLFLMADNNKQIFQHTLIICNSVSLAKSLLSSSDSKFTLFLCEAYRMESLSDTCQYTDKFGKVPVGYAKKNTGLWEVVKTLGNQSAVYCAYSHVMTDTRSLVGSLNGYMFARDYVKHLLPNFGTFHLFPCVERVVTQLAFFLSGECVFEAGLKWLTNFRQLDLLALMPPPPLMHKDVESYVFESDIITQLVKGPRTFWFHYPEIEPFLPVDADGRKYSMCELNRVMKLCLIEFLCNWEVEKGETLEECFESECGGALQHEKILNATYVFNDFSLHRHFEWPLPPLLRGVPEIVAIISAYICQFFARLTDKHFDQRARMLNWLHNTMKLPMPSLHVFVEFGQCRLLQHVCSDETVLEAPLQSNAQLFAHAQASDWWSHHAEACVNIDTRGFLCMVAVIHDQLPIFQWLTETTTAFTDVPDFVSILLELGAEHNSFMVCKWIFSVEDGPGWDRCYEYKSRDGFNAHQIAARHGHYELTVFLTRIYPDSCSNWHRALTYSLNCKNTAGELADERLVGWAEKQELLGQLSHLDCVVRSTKNSNTWKCHLEEFDFIKVVFEQLGHDPESVSEHFGNFTVRWLPKLLEDAHEFYRETDTSEHIVCIFYRAISMELTDVLAFLRDEMHAHVANSTTIEVHNQLKRFVETLHSFAKELNKPQSTQFLAKWLARFTTTDKTLKKFNGVTAKFIDMLRRGVAKQSVFESYFAKQDELLESAGLNGEMFPYSHLSLRKADCGAPAELDNDSGLSFLHEAIQNKHPQAIEWLLEFRKHDAMYYCDALDYAVTVQNGDAVQQLIELGFLRYVVGGSGNSGSAYGPGTADDSGNNRNVYHFALLLGFAKNWRYHTAFVDSEREIGRRICSLFIDGMRKINVSPSDHKVSFTDCDGSVHSSSDFIEIIVISLLIVVSKPNCESGAALFCNAYWQSDFDTPENPLILVILHALFDNVTLLSKTSRSNEERICRSFLTYHFQNFQEVMTVFVNRGMLVQPHETAIISFLNSKYTSDLQMSLALNLTAYFALYAGFNIQSISFSDAITFTRNGQIETSTENGDLVKVLTRHKVAQRIRNKFVESLSVITVDEFLRRISTSPELVTSKYERGRSLLHMIALHNRDDFLSFMFHQKSHYKECNIWLDDGYGVSVLQTAVQAGASDVEDRMRTYLQSAQTICRVVQNKFSLAVRVAKLQKRQSLVAIIRIQKVYRGYKPRRHFQLFYSSRRDDIAAFHFVWSRLVNALKATGSISGEKLQSWASYKQHYDLLVSASVSINIIACASDSVHCSDGNVNIDPVDSQVQSAIDAVSRDVELDMNIDSSVPTDLATDHLTVSEAAVDRGIQARESVSAAQTCVAKCDHLEFSQSVLKWLQSADSKYRAMFQSRIERLAEGDRSYALSKRLQGCSYPIFETKLDAGMRILWTAVRRGNLSSILVWYVSKHDDVCRLAENIVTANKREIHSRHSANHAGSVIPTLDLSEESDSIELRDEDILLDPSGNCPLKIYTASRGDIPLLTTKGWAPSLRLDSKQHDACSNSGTTLLLGRSGTGKTVCLSDRMTRDRLLYAMNGQQCNQLFVSRSRRLCELVKSFQHNSAANDIDSAGKSAGTVSSVDFLTLDKFIAQMENAVNAEKGASERQFSSANRVDYQRFCEMMAVEIKTSTLDAVVLWTQIRSFLKGSLEALLCQLKLHRVLSVEEYCSETKFAPDRCRLSPEQRRKAYAFYQQYQHRMTSDGLWDDADRVLDLLTRSKLQPLSACNGKGADYHKVYVDEVQDNTQAEIVLYFLAAGMNTQSLFLAGDPAQSVVEGVDFRFEEVRAIVHELSNGSDRIDRPSKLFVNYRSHSGVLNCAAAFLDKLFAMFPGSAKVLPRDAGLFKGPRPAFFTANNADNLITLLSRNESIVVLCHDASLGELKAMLSSDNSGTAVNNTMLGIRAAKGMEYKDVLLFDFFGEIPETDHKPWKTLFSTKLHSECEAHSHPQIESQLKLLYTAVTRSCNRLIFVESALSSVFSAFCRWMKSRELAEPFIPSADGAAVLMTSDEWRVRGIEFALSAEGNEMEQFLSQAVHCFACAGDKLLLSRAEVQLELFHLHRKLLNRDVALSADGNLQPREEMETVAVLVRGVKHHFTEEVRSMCELLQPIVKENILFVQNVLATVNDVLKTKK